ncbi:MAG: sulfatase-like hydrolase/transferase, partial [Leptospirales bacterium]
RATVLYLHSRGERAETVPLDGVLGFLAPRYYIEDIQSFFWLAGLCMLLGLWISRRILLRQALIASLLFLTLALYVAGVNYYATYEVQFGWNHILKWEGTDEMLTSIRAETPWLAVYAVLGGGIALAAWAIWSARLLTGLRAQTLAAGGAVDSTGNGPQADAATAPATSARAYANLAVWPGGARLLALSLVLAPAPWAGLNYHSGAADRALAAEMNFEESYRHEIERTLGTNVLNQLLFTLGRTKSDRYDLMTPDGKRFVSKRPFRFGFETDSLEWLAANSAAGDAPTTGAAGVTNPGPATRRAKLIAPIDFPARGKKYNVVLYFFESTAAEYLAESVEAYPGIPPRTIKEMLADFESEDGGSGQTGVHASPPAARHAGAPERERTTGETIAAPAADIAEAVVGQASDQGGDRPPAPGQARAPESAGAPEELSVAPTWERLAENSLVALQHYVQAPLSINSLFTILTSAYALPADRWVATDYPDIPLISLPEILKQAGYRTGVFHTGTYHYAG